MFSLKMYSYRRNKKPSSGSKTYGKSFRDILESTVPNPSKVIFLPFLTDFSRKIISKRLDYLESKIILYLFKN